VQLGTRAATTSSTNGVAIDATTGFVLALPWASPIFVNLIDNEDDE
jgi:hypothetical protein